MSGVVDHVGIRVSDFPASRRMYAAALAELGFSVLGEGAFDGDQYVLFGRDGNDDFSLHSVGSEPGRDRATSGAHVAFIGRNRGRPLASCCARSRGYRQRSARAAARVHR